MIFLLYFSSLNDFVNQYDPPRQTQEYLLELSTQALTLHPPLICWRNTWIKGELLDDFVWIINICFLIIIRKIFWDIGAVFEGTRSWFRRKFISLRMISNIALCFNFPILSLQSVSMSARLVTDSVLRDFPRNTGIWRKYPVLTPYYGDFPPNLHIAGEIPRIYYNFAMAVWFCDLLSCNNLYSALFSCLLACFYFRLIVF